MKQNMVERKIMWGDLDSLGIVFYPRFYEWIDASGHLFFESIGLNMGELWQQRNIVFGLAETSCRYLRPVRYHQSISIVTGIRELEKKTVLLEHRIKSAGREELLVEGVEKRICLDVSDLKDLKAVFIPGDIYQVLKEASEG